MNNVQNKLFATQIKNFSAEIEQLAQDQMIVHKTRDLFDTDFGKPSKLLTDGHFSITKICPSNKSLAECWKTNATGNDKITYKRIDGQVRAFTGNWVTVILKNGVIFGYTVYTTNGKNYLKLYADVNGNDKPNIVGRDVFAFYMDSKGHIVSFPLDNPDYKYSDKVRNCKSNNSSPYYCYSALVDNGWKMDY